MKELFIIPVKWIDNSLMVCYFKEGKNE